MSHWDEAMAELSSFGCSPAGIGVLGTSPMDNVLDMFGGVMKNESDESMNEGQQEGDAGGSRGGGKRAAGRRKNGGTSGGCAGAPQDDDETSDDRAKAGGGMDLDDELAEMADTLLLLGGQ